MEPQMPAELPKPRKRAAGGASRETTPLAIRFHGVDSSSAFSKRARQRISRKLGRFAQHITRATLRIEDLNGPKGGLDKVCRIKIVVPAAPTIVAEHRARDVYTAFDGALESAEKALRRSLVRRRGTLSPTSTAPRGPRKAEAESESSGRDTSRSRPTSAKPRSRTRRRRAVAAFERTHRKRPSRKSTRASINRGKQDDALRLRATHQTQGPTAKASRARTRASKGKGNDKNKA